MISQILYIIEVIPNKMPSERYDGVGETLHSKIHKREMSHRNPYQQQFIKNNKKESKHLRLNFAWCLGTFL